MSQVATTNDTVAPTQQSIPRIDAQTPASTVSEPYRDPTPDEVLTEFQARMQWGVRHSFDWRKEAKELFDFEAGHQWLAEDEEKLKTQNRPMVTFNVLSKFIDAVVGLQINNRQDIRCFPRQLGDTQVNELAT